MKIRGDPFINLRGDTYIYIYIYICIYTYTHTCIIYVYVLIMTQLLLVSIITTINDNIHITDSAEHDHQPNHNEHLIIILDYILFITLHYITLLQQLLHDLIILYYLIA